MTAYLVLARCMNDDIPLGIFTDLLQAMRMAECQYECDIRRVAQKFGVEKVSEILQVEIVVFHASELLSRAKVREFSYEHKS